MGDRAFLCGINDYHTIGDLRGCVADVDQMRRLLTDRFGFDAASIRCVTDAAATKSAVSDGWRWLMGDARPGDRRVFHFSGHGSQVLDTDGDESDGVDECLCLYAMDWDDPTTFVSDDDLRRWTAEIPDGVAVTFTLDCCHSGTGTRMVLPPLSKAARSDTRSAASYEITDGGASSPRGGGVDARARLARYAPPPPRVQVRIDRARRGTGGAADRGGGPRTASRSGGRMNHVLWSGCRDDQTAADAFIDGSPTGAFTHHFCRAVRERSAAADSRTVHGDLVEGLRRGGFGQRPQLEPEGHAAPVFGPVASEPIRKSDGGVASGAFAGSGGAGAGGANSGVAGTGSGGASSGGSGAGSGGASSGESGAGSGSMTGVDGPTLVALMRRQTDALEAIREALPGVVAGRATGGGSSSNRSLVYVHGITDHPADYSDPWWAAMRPHLTPSLAERLEEHRYEVLWSRHVSGFRSVASAEASEEPDDDERRRLEAELRAALAEREAVEVERRWVEGRSAAASGGGPGVPDPPRGVGTRAWMGIPFVDGIDDFVKYLLVPRIRRAVQDEFISVVRPRIEAGDRVDVISHSWGTVVAYEALHRMNQGSHPSGGSASGGGASGGVGTWFTVGAALAISAIARRVRPDHGGRPPAVEHWVNLDAVGDPVGGPLAAAGFGVDDDHPRLPAVGCGSSWIRAGCAHSSYFRAANVRVNRDIFAATLNVRSDTPVRG